MRSLFLKNVQRIIYLLSLIIDAVKAIFYWLPFIFIIPYVFIRCRLIGRSRNLSNQPRLLWGPVPILNNKYWSISLRELGFVSDTFMTNYYSINIKEDYDIYMDEFIYWSKITKRYFSHFFPYFVFLKVIRSYDIFHLPCTGFVLSKTFMRRWEPLLFKMARVKTIVIPYGGDFYRYSQNKSSLLTHVLLKSYPGAAKTETNIQEDVQRWVKYSDAFIPAIQLDGIGRWDILAPSILCIDTYNWSLSKPKEHFADGRNGVVKVMHTPNHRGFKGTEFIIQAIEELKMEGLQVELLLIEGKPNTEVKRIMLEEADILAEQLIFNGYALSGVEGMASGVPVLSNLSDSAYTTVFKLYSFLSECPIMSSNPQSIKKNLRLLITTPSLRQELGNAGRKYVEKYHSYKSSQFIFTEIYNKIWYNQEVNLLELFEPLNKNSYNNQSNIINHPLDQNQLSIN